MNLVQNFTTEKDFIDSANQLLGGSTKSPYVALKRLILKKERKSTARANLPIVVALVRKLTGKVQTLDKRFTEMRKAYYKHLPKDYVNSQLSLSKDERQSKIDSQAIARTKMLNDMFQITNNQIKSIPQKFIDSEDWRDHALLLILATGRRLIEVLKVTPKPKLSENETNRIIIKKQAKNGAKPRTNFEVPLILISFDQMKKSWNIVRTAMKQHKKKTNEELSDILSKSVNQRMGDIMPAGTPRRFLKSHILRKIYGTYSFKTFGKPRQNLILYLNDVLGHAVGGEATSLNYNNIEIVEEPPEYPEEKKEPKVKKVKEPESKDPETGSNLDPILNKKDPRFASMLGNPTGPPDSLQDIYEKAEQMKAGKNMIYYNQKFN